jgi:hypothetical protein
MRKSKERNNKDIKEYTNKKRNKQRYVLDKIMQFPSINKPVKKLIFFEHFSGIKRTILQDGLRI